MNRDELRAALKHLDRACMQHITNAAASDEVRDALSDLSEYLMRAHDGHVRLQACVSKIMLKLGINK